MLKKRLNASSPRKITIQVRLGRKACHREGGDPRSGVGGF
jgi:hypothetical protein